MPRTRQDLWVYYWWADGYCGSNEIYGPERYSTGAEALDAWDYDAAVDPDQPRLGLCILDEANHVAYIRPGHPNSVANPEKLTQKILTASGRTREGKWEIKEMEEEV